MQLVKYLIRSLWRHSLLLAVDQSNKSTASQAKEVTFKSLTNLFLSPGAFMTNMPLKYGTGSRDKVFVGSATLTSSMFHLNINLDPPAPINVVVVRFDSTSIGVSWTKYTLVELKGLANYTVTYNIIIGSRKRQLGGTVTVPWTENRVIISNLQPGAEYDVTVSTSATAGTSRKLLN